MLKLITKLPEEKDPVICLCFEKEWDAQKTNADLVTKFRHDTYQIRFMPTEGCFMNLMLIGNENERLYKNIAYDYHKFIWWYEYTKNLKSFSFCHISEKFDKHIIARVVEGNRPFVLKSTGYVLVDHDRMGFML